MTKTYTVKDPSGFHAKAITALVNECSKYGGHIGMTCSGTTVDAKSIMGVMSLGIKSGETFELEADDSAFAGLEAILKDNKII